MARIKNPRQQQDDGIAGFHTPRWRGSVTRANIANMTRIKKPRQQRDDVSRG